MHSKSRANHDFFCPKSCREDEIWLQTRLLSEILPAIPINGGKVVQKTLNLIEITTFALTIGSKGRDFMRKMP